MVKTYIPKRADIVWLDFEPQKGKEIQKTRPAAVISPEQYNKKTGLALFMPITSQIKGYPFEVLIDLNGIRSAILCDQIRSLDWVARKARYITTITEEQIQDALERFRVLVD